MRRRSSRCRNVLVAALMAATLALAAPCKQALAQAPGIQAGVAATVPDRSVTAIPEPAGLAGLALASAAFSMSSFRRRRVRRHYDIS